MSNSLEILDNAERRRPEYEFAIENERLSAALRLTGDAMVITDAEGRILLINKVAEELTGWLEEKAIGKSLCEVFHIINEKTGKRRDDLTECVMRTGGMLGAKNPEILIARDGTERNIINNATPIYDEEGVMIGMTMAFRDVTGEQRMLEDLLKTQKLDSISILASGIAHDLNNILTVILGNISLAKIYTNPRDTKSSQRLAEAEKASMQAKALTSQLLASSKGGSPVLETASALELIEHSAGYVLKGSNAKTEISAPDELWPLEIDVAQIGQVISNLVINSSQAMPESGIIKICARNVIVGTESHLPLKAGTYVKISVQDHGIGISERHLQKVFEPYFTTNREGNGLGLTISNLIIRNHNGHIAVESQEGVGTTFSVYLPASPEKVVTRNGVEESLMVGEGKILMMDDEDIVRDLARETLSSIGYKVTTAKDGAEAIELYRQAHESNNPFSAVIMDLTVPGGMGGREAIRKLNEIDPEARVIVSSGYSNDPVMSNFRDYGFKGAIAKPYGVKELSEILHAVTAN